VHPDDRRGAARVGVDVNRVDVLRAEPEVRQCDRHAAEAVRCSHEVAEQRGLVGDRGLRRRTRPRCCEQAQRVERRRGRASLQVDGRRVERRRRQRPAQEGLRQGVIEVVEREARRPRGDGLLVGVGDRIRARVQRKGLSFGR